MSDSTTQTESSGGKLRGSLGTTAIVLMVVAAAAPLTTMGASLPAVITIGQSVSAPLAFLVAGVVFLLFALGFVAMTRYVTSAGAFYAYIERGLGRRFGVAAACVAWVAYTATMIAVYGFIGATLTELFAHFFGVQVPWLIMSLAVILVIAILGYRHIELSAKVLGIFLIAEIAVVVILDLVIVLQGGSDGLTGDSFTPEGIGNGLGVAMLFALFGFVGVEATAIFRDETKDPERTVRRATYWAVAVIAIFYAISSWAIIEGNGGILAVGVATEDPDNFVVNTAYTYLGMVGRDVTQVLLVVSLFACALSFHNIATRYQFVLGRSGVAHSALGRVHERHGSPANSSLVLSIIAAVIISVLAAFQLDPLLQIYSPIGGVGITGLAFLWLLTSVSVVVFFARKGGAAGTVAVGVASVATMAGGLFLILSNMPLVVGGTALLATVMAAIPFVFGIVGFIVSRRATRELGDS